MSNTHPTGPQGQPPFGPQGQPPFGPQGQPPFGPQGQSPYGSTGTAPYGPPAQAPYGWTGQPLSQEQIAAQARAAKAQAKAQRPWFKKKRFVLPLGAVALFTVVGVAGGGGDTSAVPQPAVAASTDPTADSTSADEKAAAKKEADAKKEAAAAKEAKAAKEAAVDEAKSGAKIGSAVTSGDFKVTITKVREGGKRVGDEYFGEKAQGRYVMVDLKIKNIGDRADYFSSSNVKLLDGDGREFSVDEMASIHVSDNNPLLEEVNPGNTSKGTFAFDLPKGVDVEQAQISAGGLFEGPVTVKVG